ncbi:MAG TPA: M15 family metallopeptidase [Cyclobacteriaceae bacterium]|jgi:D-alanyl-D-alanine dipeptidase
MSKAFSFLVFLTLLCPDLAAQYKYGLTPATLEEYLQHVRQNPDKQLIDLEKYIPDVVLDIRYSTINNFTGQKIYNLAKAYARTFPTHPVADPEIRKNRDLLIQIMERYGFRVNASEWWHFDFQGYRAYEILDISFEELQGL